jgi:hypothetical protein
MFILVYILVYALIEEEANDWVVPHFEVPGILKH